MTDDDKSNTSWKSIQLILAVLGLYMLDKPTNNGDS